MDVSMKIKILLVRRNMNQSALAEKLNIAPQNLSRKLKDGKINRKSLEKIAKALNCTVTFKEPEFILNDTKEVI